MGIRSLSVLGSTISETDEEVLQRHRERVLKALDELDERRRYVQEQPNQEALKLLRQRILKALRQADERRQRELGQKSILADSLGRINERIVKTVAAALTKRTVERRKQTVPK